PEGQARKSLACPSGSENRRPEQSYIDRICLPGKTMQADGNGTPVKEISGADPTRRSKMWKLGTLVGLLLLAAPGSAQEVYRNVSAGKLEALLQELKINARKVGSKNDGIVYYHFKHDSYEIRLHNYNGKD